MNILQLTLALREYVKEHGREKAFVLLFETPNVPVVRDDIPKFLDSNYGPGELMEIFNDRFDIIWIPSAGIMRFRQKENPIKKVLEKHLGVHYNNCLQFIENGIVKDGCSESLLASIHNFSGVLKIYNGYMSYSRDDFEENEITYKYKEVYAIAANIFKISI